MQSKEVEWILIEDKLKKEWKKQDAYKEKNEEEKSNIIQFKRLGKDAES
jgi:hypothetical protein|tara:strand:+ start:1656 stop:1802 length:147 start_codon:yes stop_codon:yes gene_type:complete